jgi:hypothetical protein
VVEAAVQAAVFLGLLIAALVGRWLGPRNEPETDREVIVSWLTCHDCGTLRLDTVIGRAAVREQAVVETLKQDLIGGPGVRLVALDRTLRRMRYADSVYLHRRGLVLPVTNADSFVARSKARFEKAWRRRAAIALAAIYRQLGSQRALAALQSVPDSAPYLALDPMLRDTVHYYGTLPPP